MLRYATDLGIVAAPCLCGKKESGPVGRLTTFLLFCRITNVGYRLFMTDNSNYFDGRTIFASNVSGKGNDEC